MNYGLYTSASGAMANLYKQDVLANNLANVNTIGFKPHEVLTRQRLPERLEGGHFADPKLMLEKLGGGVFIDPTYINLKQGSLVKTGQNLDIAVRGEGFLVASTAQGTDAERLRLTRDGRMTLNAEGELVMSTTGLPFLDSNDRTIRVDTHAPVTIQPNGDVVQRGEVLARLQVVQPPPQDQVVKAGENMLRFDNTAQVSRQPANVDVVQGHVESSAVDPIMTLNALIAATKAVQGNAKMMQYHDHIMGEAVNTLGRVA